MVRTPFIDRNGIKRGPWSEDEDNKLRTFVERFGHSNWRQLPKYAGLMRCGKSCRLRWMNYLRPGLKKGNYSHEEEQLIVELHKQLGNRWSAIAAKLPGRSDNDVKNHWHAHLKKRVILINTHLSTSTLNQFTECCENEDDKTSYDAKQHPIIPSDLSNKLMDLIDEEDNYMSSTEQLSIFTSLELPVSDSFSWTKTIDNFQSESFDNFWSEQLLDNFWTQPFFYFFIH